MLKAKKKETGIVITILTIFFSIISIINFNGIEINHVNLYSDKISQNYDIVHLSDIHLGTVDGNYLRKVVSIVNEITPDLVLITGDLFDSESTDYTYLEPIENLNQPTYFTLGNHEFYVDLKNVENMVGKTQINLLRNQSSIFEELSIIGIDDNDDKNTVKNTLSEMNIKNESYNILMYHRPIGFEDAVSNNIDLMLSGHTHAGQIIPFNILVKLAYPYDKGLFNINESYIYVSQGTALWGPKMRLGSRNEITVFNLISK